MACFLEARNKYFKTSSQRYPKPLVLKALIVEAHPPAFPPPSRNLDHPTPLHPKDLPKWPQHEAAWRSRERFQTGALFKKAGLAGLLFVSLASLFAGLVCVQKHFRKAVFHSVICVREISPVLPSDPRAALQLCGGSSASLLAAKLRSWSWKAAAFVEGLWRLTYRWALWKQGGLSLDIQPPTEKAHKPTYLTRIPENPV